MTRWMNVSTRIANRLAERGGIDDVIDDYKPLCSSIYLGDG